jgi:hypothetical protein
MTGQWQAQGLRMVTHGQFKVDHVRDETHRCGPLGTPRVYGYEVVAEMDPKDLSEEVFMFDWQKVSDWFAQSFSVVEVLPSCEVLALQALDSICHMLGNRCSRLEVTIGGDGVPAGMTASYRRPQS